MSEHTELEREPNRRSALAVKFRRLMRSPTAVAGLVIVIAFLTVALIGPLVMRYDPTAQNLMRALEGASRDHYLGTDHLGRDSFTRLVYGARVSLYIGAMSVLAGSLIGCGLGLVAGYFGGRTDAVVMRLIDIQMAFPGMLLAIMIISVLGPGLMNTIVALTVFTIPSMARIMRASVIGLRNLEYVEAATALGHSPWGIMKRHIVPNAMSPVLVQGSLRFGQSILTASGLSFLGLGVQPPNPEWGAILATAREYLLFLPIYAIAPGVAISLVVLGFSMLGDGLRDVLDPRLKQ